MSYKTRNLIILSSLFTFILLVGGYFTLFHFPGKIKNVNKEIGTLKKQIAALDGIEEKYVKMLDLIKEKEAKIAANDKQIDTKVTPAGTYQYLNSILGYSGVFDFNLFYGGSKNEKEYGYASYNLRGEGAFTNIYRFIWFMERGPKIYKVNRLNLHAVESVNEERGITEIVIPFEMEIRALYANLPDMPKVKRTLNDVRLANARNPFYPYVRANIPPNFDGLLEAERAELRAIVSGKALIADHTGVIHMVQPGDEVYLGYVSRINPEKNEVEFTLNKGGIIERFVLKLSFDKQEGRIG